MREKEMTLRAADTVAAFYRTVFEIGDIDAASLMMAEDFVDHAPWPGHPATREGLQAGTRQMRVTFPDLVVEAVKMIEEEDKVAVVIRMTGTQRGEFMGHAATGRAFEIEGVDILRVKDGKLREHWGVIDSERMLAQLRIAPSA
jgi:steroid delta-isomerase-like uncharacterized protein